MILIFIFVLPMIWVSLWAFELVFLLFYSDSSALLLFPLPVLWLFILKPLFFLLYAKILIFAISRSYFNISSFDCWTKTSIASFFCLPISSITLLFNYFDFFIIYSALPPAELVISILPPAELVISIFSTY